MPTTYSWSLVPDPTPVVPTPAQAATTQAATNTSKGLPSFLGQGLIRPFQRDLKNDFASDSGSNLVVACVGQILGTRADSAAGPGELPWRTDFGSRLHLVRHRNNNDVANNLATVMVQEALTAWEPRVTAVTASVEPTSNPRVMQVRVKYNVVDRGGSTILADQTANVPVQSAS
jgi:phage baseplate assembly protein W